MGLTPAPGRDAVNTNRCWICAGCSDTMAFANDAVTVDCRSCGKYHITGSLLASGFPLPDAERHLMSFWGRQRTLNGAKPMLLDSNSIKEVVASLQRPSHWEKPDLLVSSM